MEILTSIASSPRQRKHFLSNSEFYFPLCFCKTTGKKTTTGKQQSHCLLLSSLSGDPSPESGRPLDEPIKKKKIKWKICKTSGVSNDLNGKLCEL